MSETTKTVEESTTMEELIEENVEGVEVAEAAPEVLEKASSADLRAALKARSKTRNEKVLQVRAYVSAARKMYFCVLDGRLFEQKSELRAHLNDDSVHPNEQIIDNLNRD